MKKLQILFIPFVVLLSANLTAQEIQFVNYKAGEFKQAENDEAKVSANMGQSGTNPTEWNYGTIENGSTGIRYFKFTNTGTGPLVISSAKGSCGCTVPTYSKEPVMPGESSFITVKYDTKRTGAFTKYVTLTTNAKSNTSVRLKVFGTVNAPATAPATGKSLFDEN